MIHLAILTLALCGFALLHLSMARHQQDWFHRKLTKRMSGTLRFSGFVALLGAFVGTERSCGWAYGLLTWLGWLTIAASIIALITSGRGQIKQGSKQ